LTAAPDPRCNEEGEFRLAVETPFAENHEAELGEALAAEAEVECHPFGV
jgi:hypothetical protein